MHFFSLRFYESHWKKPQTWKSTKKIFLLFATFVHFVTGKMWFSHAPISISVHVFACILNYVQKHKINYQLIYRKKRNIGVNSEVKTDFIIARDIFCRFDSVECCRREIFTKYVRTYLDYIYVDSAYASIYSSYTQISLESLYAKCDLENRMALASVKAFKSIYSIVDRITFIERHVGVGRNFLGKQISLFVFNVFKIKKN